MSEVKIVNENKLMQDIRLAIESLYNLEKAVAEMYVGINEKPMSQKEIASVFGMYPNEVCNLLKAIKHKIAIILVVKYNYKAEDLDEEELLKIAREVKQEKNFISRDLSKNFPEYRDKDVIEIIKNFKDITRKEFAIFFYELDGEAHSLKEIAEKFKCKQKGIFSKAEYINKVIAKQLQDNYKKIIIKSKPVDNLEINPTIKPKIKTDETISQKTKKGKTRKRRNSDSEYLERKKSFFNLLAGKDELPQPLPKQERDEWFKKLRNGNQEARKILTYRNLRLVAEVTFSIVESGRNTEGNDTHDLFQMGCIGLIKAIDNFDFKFNTNFYTYAKSMIAGTIKNQLDLTSSIKRNPSDKYLAYKITETRYSFYGQYRKYPTTVELADILKTSEDKIKEALKASIVITNLEDTVYADKDGSERTGMDFLEDETNIDEQIDSLELRKHLLSRISALNERERTIVLLRLGVNSNVKTQLEVAKLLNITQSYVARLEAPLFKELQHVIDEYESDAYSEESYISLDDKSSKETTEEMMTKVFIPSNPY